MQTTVFNNSKTPFQEKENNESNIIKQIDKYDATMLSYLARLYEGMTGDKMDLKQIKSAVDALATYNKKAEYAYLNDLLYPEKCKGVKIPSPIPVPSCSFQLHNCVTLTTNSSGNLAFTFNPFFLANSNGLTWTDDLEYDIAGTTYKFTEAEYLSTLWVNNDTELTGYQQNENWRPINIGQTIPNVYDQYRLVSASVVVKYIGRLDITSGVIGGAIVYDDNRVVGAKAKTVNPDSPSSTVWFETKNRGLQKYGNFDLAMDSFYHQENLVIEGIRELYFPLDNSYEEYTKLSDVNHLSLFEGQNDTLAVTDADIYKSGFNYFVYVLGAPANSSCFKVDIYCNYECLPNASFLNYLPLSMNSNTITNADKKNAIATVQKKPISSLKEQQTTIVKPSIWEKMKSKFGNALPGIQKLISWGLGTMIPSLKPGLALAGSLLSANEASVMEEEVE